MQWYLKFNVDFFIDKNYPDSIFRYDFYIKKIDYFIEIAGLIGEIDGYDEKMIMKKMNLVRK